MLLIAELAEKIARLKKNSLLVAAMTTEDKNKALSNIAEELYDRKDEVILANAQDLRRAEIDGVPAPIYKRLKFDESKLIDVVDGIRALIKLEDPVGRTLLQTELDEGLELRKVTCPIGVIGVIFESRPDALVQIATLCLKSGNAVIVKGGSEAKNTNRILAEIIGSAACNGVNMPTDWIVSCETRAEIKDLLKMEEYIDLLIPRGSNEFIRYIMDNSKIPVMGHADGICHCYVDESADVDMTRDVVVDAKTQYVAVCNALETLLVHKDAARRVLPATTDALVAKGVEIRGCERTLEALAESEDAPRPTEALAESEVSPRPTEAPDGSEVAPRPTEALTGYEVAPRPTEALTGAEVAPRPTDRVKLATEDDWKTEYLDNVLSIKIVDNIDEAIEHINKYGSHHTDSIITNNKKNIEKFMLLVDSANVFHNCSTRFSDGFRYGFGAEVGISTGKLHARGPVGLEGLVSYKYLLFGNGHVVSDYCEKRKTFKHNK